MRTSSNDIRRGNRDTHQQNKEEASSHTNKDGNEYVLNRNKIQRFGDIMSLIELINSNNFIFLMSAVYKKHIAIETTPF